MLRWILLRMVCQLVIFMAWGKRLKQNKSLAFFYLKAISTNLEIALI